MITFINVLIAMIYYSVKNYYTNKIYKKHLINYLSSFHAISSCIFCFLYFQTNQNKFLGQLALGNTGGYYLYDTVEQYVNLNKKFSISTILYIYHHLTSLYTFNNYDLVKYKLGNLLYMAELANVPTKYVYYLLTEEKLNNNKYFITNIMKIIQLFSYIYVRIYKVSLLYYYLFYSVEDRFPLYLNLPMYVIGIGWTYAIYERTQFKNILKIKIK